MTPLRSALAITLICVLFSPMTSAGDVLSPVEIDQKIIKSVTAYVNAISCPEGEIEAKNIIPLVPYTHIEDRSDAKYVVLSAGDIGCVGGSGSWGTHLSFVTIGAGNTFVVDPLRSSPAIQFESPVRLVERIVGHTAVSLTLEGNAYGQNDANCCPSVRERFTLRLDKKRQLEAR